MNVESMVEDEGGRMKVEYAIDLYKKEIFKVDLGFSNPFGKVTTLSYNPRMQSLTSWDGGKQLLYPIKYGTRSISGSSVNQFRDLVAFED